MRRFALRLLALLIVSACGGPSDRPSAPETPTAARTAAPSPGPANVNLASPAAAASGTANTAPGQAPTGGSGAGADACALITTDEVGRVVGAAGVTAEPFRGDPSFCTYRDGTGARVAATAHLRTGSGDVFNNWAARAQSVPGLGERALWDANSGTLMVLKNGSMLSISAGTGRLQPAVRQDLARQLATIGVARQ